MSVFSIKVFDIPLFSPPIKRIKGFVGLNSKRGMEADDKAEHTISIPEAFNISTSTLSEGAIAISQSSLAPAEDVATTFEALIQFLSGMMKDLHPAMFQMWLHM